MAFTLFDLQLNAHEKVGTVRYGQSSKSSGTTTIEDQTESSATNDDEFVGGTLYFIRSLSDTNTTALWFEKQTARILDYDASSGQFVFATWSTHTSAATSGLLPASIEYGIATPEFNESLMNRLSNAAVRTVGPLVGVDRSIQSSASQTIYTMSTIATRGKPFLVEIMGRTGSSADDPNWVELHGWKIEPSTAGEGNRIRFPRSLPANRDVQIWFEYDHPELTASTQIISGLIHPELVTLALVEKMYEYRNSRARGAEEFDIQRWNDAKRQFAEARIRWPIWRPRKMPGALVIDRAASGTKLGANPERYLD